MLKDGEGCVWAAAEAPHIAVAAATYSAGPT